MTEQRWRDPIAAARAWAVATAGTHRQDSRRQQLAEMITPQLIAELANRSDAYLDQLHSDFAAFRADQRVIRDQTLASNELADWLNDSTRRGERPFLQELR